MARSSKSATKQRSSKSKQVKSAVNNSVNDKLKDELLSYYRDMVLIRRFEEKAGQLYGMGLMRGLLSSLHRSGSRCCWNAGGHR